MVTMTRFAQNAIKELSMKPQKFTETELKEHASQLAAIGKALDYGEMFVVMCRDGKWIPDRNISPSVTKFLQIVREGRESFKQYQAGAALSSPSPAKTDVEVERERMQEALKQNP
jgi:hypothetical protein